MIRYFGKILFTLLFFVFLFGCAGSKKEVKPGGEAENASKMDESFDPLTLQDADIVFNEVNETKSENNTEKSSILTLPDNSTVLPEKNKLIDGYRVQLLSTKDVDNAMQMKQIAMEKLGDLHERFYLDFDSPYYKVRMGDFKTRDEAQKVRDEARMMGYSEAWVTKAKVWSNPSVETQETPENSVPPDSLN